MPEKQIEQGQKPSDQAQDEAAKKLLDDTRLGQYIGASTDDNALSGITTTTLGRVAYVTGEGLAKAPAGAWKSFLHQIDHPDELAHTAGMGALFGVGLRIALPKAGAAKALVGTAMTYFLVKDGLQPVFGGWMDAADANDMTGLHSASTRMGDGLGKFTVNAGIGLTSGLVAEGVTGAVLTRTASGRRWEASKEHFFNSEETAAGRFFKWSERTADGTSDYVAGKLLGKRRTAADELTLQEKLEAIKLYQKSHSHSPSEGAPAGPAGRVDLEHVNTHRRHRSEDFSAKIDELLAKTDEVVAAEAAAKNRLAPQTVKPQQILRVTEERPGAPAEGIPPITETAPLGKTEGTPPATKDAPPVGKDVPPVASDGIVITDAAAKPAAVAPTAEMSGVNVSDMAVAMREVTGRVTKEDIAVAQAKEDVMGPLMSTMRDGKAPLDPLHFENNKLLLDLTRQIKTADDYRSAGMLLDHFRTATQQVEIAARLGKDGGGELAVIADLNMFSRSISARMYKYLDDCGIPRSVVRGENAPLFTIRDADGAGQYTIPAIKDPVTGKPVTDAAVVVQPREYQGTEGVSVSGVHPHELGHNLRYGDLYKFPEAMRDVILTDKIVGDAMKAKGIADVDVAVPGAPGGKMKKSELFVQVLKAQANENTADMFGTSIDPNTGLALAVLLGSLRKPGPGNPTGAGMLETRSMYGKDMVNPEMHNTLGIEVHGLDKWRVKLAAETVRQQGDGHKGCNDFAASLDKLADSMARPGDHYVFANADAKGEFFSIPMAEWDAIIPALVRAQFNTKLDILNGHTVRDITPNMTETFTKVEALTNMMADAAIKDQPAVIGFDKTGYRIEEVFSAGLSAWLRAVAKNNETGGTVSAEVMMARINRLSEGMRAKFRDDVPEMILTGGNKEPISMRLANVATAPLSFVARATGHAAEAQPRIRDTVARWTPRIGGYAGAMHIGPGLEHTLKDLLETKAVERQMLNPVDGK